MPVLSPKEALRRLKAIMKYNDFGEAAHELGGITKETLQEWARDNPDLISPSTYQTMLTASERQREHLARARGELSQTIRAAEVPMDDLRFHCLGPCDKIYDNYQGVINHRRGQGIACKGASYSAVLPDEEVSASGVHIQVALPHDSEDDEELLRAIVATLDERDMLLEKVGALEVQAARRRTVWSSVRERLLGRG